ncbi:MAG: histone deacetylase, partial [Gammaproteobacteria bacterium]|nr:histone deacetylase [Gammaproteobacteria bacterium]
MNRRLFLSFASLAGLLVPSFRRPLAGAPVSGHASTGLLYDEIFLDHWLEPGHPESPQRLRAVHSALLQAQLLENVLLPGDGPDAHDWITTVHTSNHVDSIRRHYPQAHTVTSQVVSGVLRAVSGVCNGEFRNAFCATRPPGHHAENTGREEGFCFYNSVAIAARYAQRQFDLERILIVDWDYHHGNGTESAFYTDPGVLFFSTHDLYAYPGTGHPEKTGAGAGEG